MDRMIQDIFPSCYQVAYQPRPPKPEDKCFFFRGRTVLERWDGEALVLPDYAAVAAHIGQPQFLFIIDETAYYLAEYPNALESPEGYEWHDLRHERSKKSRVLYFAEATAYHLAEWYGANRFCGRCGERTQPDLAERMLRCPKCGNLIYPKIAPAVIVAVTRGDQILMTRYQGIRADRRVYGDRRDGRRHGPPGSDGGSGSSGERPALLRQSALGGGCQLTSGIFCLPGRPLRHPFGSTGTLPSWLVSSG